MFLKAKIVVIFILNTKVLETHIANLMIFKIEVYIKKFFLFPQILKYLEANSYTSFYF